MLKTPATSFVQKWASGLRFPQLLVVTLILLGLDLAIPDLVPFADEVLLALLALLLGSLRRDEEPSQQGKREEKNVTDRGNASTHSSRR